MESATIPATRAVRAPAARKANRSTSAFHHVERCGNAVDKISCGGVQDLKSSGYAVDNETALDRMIARWECSIVAAFDSFSGAKNFVMAHALNLTLRIKQDPETQKKLAHIAAIFPTEIQTKIDEALRVSQRVHFARVLVIDNTYLQVITEYDGSHTEYTEFFREKLPDVFGLLFSLAENAPPPETMLDDRKFFAFSKSLQVRSLGDATNGDKDQDGNVAGYLFSAYGDHEVKEIQALLNG